MHAFCDEVPPHLNTTRDPHTTSTPPHTRTTRHTTSLNHHTTPPLQGPHAQKERTTGLAWSPRAYVDAADAPALLASASADTTAVLWDCRSSLRTPGAEDDQAEAPLPVQVFRGHKGE